MDLKKLTSSTVGILLYINPLLGFIVAVTCFGEKIDLQQALAQGAAIGDYKSALQERLQATGLGQPRYVLTDESGPDHKRLFRVAVEIRNGEGTTTLLAESEGSTKKRAQQEAARLALLELERSSGRGSDRKPLSAGVAL